VYPLDDIQMHLRDKHNIHTDIWEEIKGLEIFTNIKREFTDAERRPGMNVYWLHKKLIELESEANFWIESMGAISEAIEIRENKLCRNLNTLPENIKAAKKVNTDYQNAVSKYEFVQKETLRLNALLQAEISYQYHTLNTAIKGSVL
jgi:hypothetical protein